MYYVNPFWDGCFDQRAIYVLGGLARIVHGRQDKRQMRISHIMLGERPTDDVFALTAHIRTAPISIDVAIFRVIQCVKEFTNGATPSWAG